MRPLHSALTIWFALFATAAIAQSASNGTASGGIPGDIMDPRGMPGADIGAKVNAAIASWRSSIEETIVQGIATGEIKPDVHPATYATTFIALLEGGILLSKVTGDLGYFNNALERIVTLIRTEMELPK